MAVFTQCCTPNASKAQCILFLRFCCLPVVLRCCVDFSTKAERTLKDFPNGVPPTTDALSICSPSSSSFSSLSRFRLRPSIRNRRITTISRTTSRVTSLSQTGNYSANGLALMLLRRTNRFGTTSCAMLCNKPSAIGFSTNSGSAF